MNKKDLISQIVEEVPVTRKEAGRFLDVVINAISTALVSGDKVRLIGLGSFYVKNTRGRKGRNPRTGEELQISPSRRISFKSGKKLKRLMGWSG